MTALTLVWRSRDAAAASHEFWLTLSLLLAITTITILPGQSVFDHVILLPGIFLLASRKQPGRSSPIFRALLVVGLAVLLWPWVAALGLIGLRPFLSPEQFYSEAVFALPLRTAAAFPFVVLGIACAGFVQDLETAQGASFCSSFCAMSSTLSASIGLFFPGK